MRNIIASKKINDNYTDIVRIVTNELDACNYSEMQRTHLLVVLAELKDQVAQVVMAL